VGRPGRGCEVSDFFDVVFGAGCADELFLRALRGAAVGEAALEFQVPHYVKILTIAVPGVGHPAAVEHLGPCMIIFDSVP
jgi:hypothetical protein